MTTFAEVIRAAFPGANAEDLEYVLWERTPYPMGKVSARSLYKAASGFRRACDHGLRLCELCDRLAAHGRWTCERCQSSLSALNPPKGNPDA